MERFLIPGLAIGAMFGVIYALQYREDKIRRQNQSNGAIPSNG